MTNVRFQGTYKFEEVDKFNGRTLPLSYDRIRLILILEGNLNFEIGNLKGHISVSRDEVFASADYIEDMRKIAVENFKKGDVDKLIKQMIIKAIRKFRDDNEDKITEVEYNELISGTTKYSIELIVKPKDLQ